MTRTADLGWCLARAAYNDRGEPVKLEIFSPPDGGEPADYISLHRKSGIDALRELLTLVSP